MILLISDIDYTHVAPDNFECQKAVKMNGLNQVLISDSTVKLLVCES